MHAGRSSECISFIPPNKQQANLTKSSITMRDTLHYIAISQALRIPQPFSTDTYTGAYKPSYHTQTTKILQRVGLARPPTRELQHAEHCKIDPNYRTTSDRLPLSGAKYTLPRTTTKNTFLLNPLAPHRERIRFKTLLLGAHLCSNTSIHTCKRTYTHVDVWVVRQLLTGFSMQGVGRIIL